MGPGRTDEYKVSHWQVQQVAGGLLGGTAKLLSVNIQCFDYNLSLLIFPNFAVMLVARPYWRCYYSNTDAIIYVVDSADKDRIGISKDELLYMLREEELAGAILVVLANKQDMEGCLSVAEVHQALGLDQLKNRTFQVSLKFETTCEDFFF